MIFKINLKGNNMKKYVSEKVLVPADLSEYYSQVIDEVYLIDKDKHKRVRFIFNDLSEITIDYKIKKDKIVDRKLGDYHRLLKSFK
jgi:hypothetical protein